MGVRRIISKRVVPTLWLVIGLVIAVSLAKIAFTGGAGGVDQDGLTPTGKIPDAAVAVERADVVNTLNLDGTIELDQSKTVNAPADGEIVKIYAGPRKTVKKGASLFQIRSMADAAPDADSADGGIPPMRYVNVVAPVTGQVGSYSAAVGDQVTKATAVVAVQPQTYRAVGSITPLDRYRLLSPPKAITVTVAGGPAPFPCTHLAIGDAATAPPAQSANPEFPEGGGPGGDAATSVSCRVPGGVTVFDGLTMTMAMDIGRAEGVLTVPVTAVRGLQGKGTVWVIGEDGIETERAVDLGVTDGQVVEVKSGLKEGESVLRYVPGSDQPEPGMGPGECNPEMGC